MQCDATKGRAARKLFCTLCRELVAHMARAESWMLPYGERWNQNSLKCGRTQRDCTVCYGPFLLGISSGGYSIFLSNVITSSRFSLKS